MSEYYLVHHGIKGQKWGKRNGPPYPLGASDHSASEKKAGWRNSLTENKQGSSKNKKNGLSDRQKTALKVGVGVVGAATVAAGAYYVSKQLGVNAHFSSKDIQRSLDMGKYAMPKMLARSNERAINQLDQTIRSKQKTVSQINNAIARGAYSNLRTEKDLNRAIDKSTSINRELVSLYKKREGITDKQRRAYIEELTKMLKEL